MRYFCISGALAVTFLLGIPMHAQQPPSLDAEASPTQPAPRADGWWMQRHQLLLQQVHAHPEAQVVFLGDSITQNYEKTGPAPNEVFHPTWERYFAPYGAINLGVSGDETQQVLWRIEHGELQGLSPAVCVLMIGTNNSDLHHEWTAEQNAAGVEAIVAEVERRLPTTHILLLGILPSNRSTIKSQTDAATNDCLQLNIESIRGLRGSTSEACSSGMEFSMSAFFMIPISLHRWERCIRIRSGRPGWQR